MTLELSLAPTTAAPARARAAISDWLAQTPHDAQSIDTARLLVSELVTNCVRHARIEAEHALRLRGWLRDTTLHLELWDAGTDGTVEARPPRRDDDVGGFGLDLVARLPTTGAWTATPTARPSGSSCRPRPTRPPDRTDTTA